MRKNGYTLAEALIALGIVGIISALVLPMVNKTKPDVQKVVYLKTYDSIVSAVKSITNSQGLYSRVTDDGTYLYNTVDAPLLDTYTQKKINGVDCGNGVGAFKKVLQVMFKGENGASSNEFVVGNKLFKVEPSTTNTHVLTADNSGNVTLYYKITVDLDKNNDNTSSFDIYNPSKVPDVFEFYVSSSGAVTPADQYGQMYVATRTNWKKLTIEEAGNKAKEYTARTPNGTTVANGVPEVSVNVLRVPKEAVSADAIPEIPGGIPNTPGNPIIPDTPKNPEIPSVLGDSEDIEYQWTLGDGLTIEDLVDNNTSDSSSATGASGTGSGGGMNDSLLNPYMDNNGNGTPDIWDCDPMVNRNMSKEEIMACEAQNNNLHFNVPTR